MNKLRLSYKVVISNVSEKMDPSLSLKERVMDLAEQKAAAVFAENRDSLVLGADTIVEIDGETIDDHFTLICVCNGRFYGGGYEPVPEASPEDGKLEVLLVKKVSRLQVAGIIGKYKAGRWAEFPALFRHFSTDRVRIRCDREEVVNLDGEARPGKDVEIRLSDKKLRFFHPRGLSCAAT